MAHFYLQVLGTPLRINGVYLCRLVKGSEILVPVQTVKHRPVSWITDKIPAESLQQPSHILGGMVLSREVNIDFKINNTENNKGYLLHCSLFRLVLASLWYHQNHQPAKMTNSLYYFLDSVLSNTRKISLMTQMARQTLWAELLEAAIFKNWEIQQKTNTQLLKTEYDQF